jgi:hypothetical protein
MVIIREIQYGDFENSVSIKFIIPHEEQRKGCDLLSDIASSVVSAHLCISVSIESEWIRKTIQMLEKKNKGKIVLYYLLNYAPSKVQLGAFYA